MAGKKKGGGLFWMPGRSHHRHKNHHKKDNHEKRSNASIASQRGPAAEAAGTAMMTKAMMSGDSPDHCRTDPLLDLKDKPVACTSNGNAARPAAETIQATVSVEPRPKVQEAVSVCGPTDATSITRRSRSTSTEDEIEMAATPLSPNKTENGENGGEALNTPVDATDSDPTKLNNIYWKNEKEEEEGCGVKCLYYTLQCCECTIM